jgi:signal transduction histidine kinase
VVVAGTATRGRVGLEAAIALVAGAAWYSLCAILLGGLLPHSPVSAIVVVVLDVAAVLAVAGFWGVNYAVPIGVAGVVALDWHYIPPTHTLSVPDPQNALSLAAYLVTGVLLGELAVLARRRAEASESARNVLAGEQDALRRVATLVALETSPPDVFASVAEEVGRLLDLDATALLRYETDGTATVVAEWSRTDRPARAGARLAVEDHLVLAGVQKTGRPARAESTALPGDRVGETTREPGRRASVGSPVLVEGRLWGVMVAASALGESIQPGTEARLGEFTGLAATAVANAEARAELAASRARVVASADRARRDIERNLHDGVQQRLVSIGLGIRIAEDLAGSGSDDLVPTLRSLRDEVSGSLDDLREISHGIHPAILSEGGLRPALANLARRSPVPVELDVRDLDGRLPEAIEVGVYYVVSEALANVVKHAEATRVELDVAIGQRSARLSVRDDGVGGADPRQGSGLLGLADRVHALGGAIEVRSPSGHGTEIDITVPLSDRAAPGASSGV